MKENEEEWGRRWRISSGNVKNSS